MLLRKANELNLFKGSMIGLRGVEITHLQFADDTIIFYEAVGSSLRNVKRTLRCFELMLGLAINFTKTCMAGINVDGGVLREWGNILACRIVDWPLKYLGMPFGCDSRNSTMWDPVIRKLEVKLGH